MCDMVLAVLLVFKKENKNDDTSIADVGVVEVESRRKPTTLFLAILCSPPAGPPLEIGVTPLGG